MRTTPAATANSTSDRRIPNALVSGVLVNPPYPGCPPESDRAFYTKSVLAIPACYFNNCQDLAAKRGCDCATCTFAERPRAARVRRRFRDFALARFLGGPSGSLTGTPNQRFVEQAYLDLLGRAADPNGLAGWSGLLDQGQASRAQVALGIEGSPEYHARVVDALYAHILHRPADITGETGWTNFLNSGGTAQQLAAELLSSDEYVNDNGNTTSGFVTGVYRDVLHRSPDAGAQSWIQYINNGISRAAVAAAILVSPESDQDVVEGFYHRFLNRAGESAGISGYVSLLQQGASWEGIEAIIIGSDEYFARAQA